MLKESGVPIQEPVVQIKNFVCVLNYNREIDIERLAEADAGLVQYEPEQFPGAVVRFNTPGSILLFKSGRAVITGVRSLAEARNLERDLGRLIGECDL